MIDLDSPLWRKLDDAHRDRDIPDVISGLFRRWDQDAARSLFWDRLCHQGTCYGTTYAAVPHLLDLADRVQDDTARRYVALFLGQVALDAFAPGGGCGGTDDGVIPQGLPLSVDAWDRKLDTYRSLARHAERDLADPDGLRRAVGYGEHADKSQSSSIVALDLARIFKRLGMDFPSGEDIEISDPVVSAEKDLARYREILARPPVDDADLIEIAQIRSDFFAALPVIGALCERAYRESPHDGERIFLLSGIAAALGERRAAHVIDPSSVLVARCENCGDEFHGEDSQEGVALYRARKLEPDGGLEQFDHDPSLLDYQDGTIERADGWVAPFTGDAVDLPDVLANLLRLAGQAGHREGEQAVRRAAGTFHCPDCGTGRELVVP